MTSLPTKTKTKNRTIEETKDAAERLCGVMRLSEGIERAVTEFVVASPAGRGRRATSVPLRAAAGVVIVMRRRLGVYRFEAALREARKLWPKRKDLTPERLAAAIAREERWYVVPDYERVIASHAPEILGQNTFKFACVAAALMRALVERNVVGGSNPVPFAALAFVVALDAMGRDLTGSVITKVCGTMGVACDALKRAAKRAACMAPRLFARRMEAANSFASEWINGGDFKLQECVRRILNDC